MLTNTAATCECKRNVCRHLELPRRDALYLFACYTEWRHSRDLVAYEQLIAALDDNDEDVRQVAENLLHRTSPRPCGSEIESSRARSR